jgi:hypothetical protein
MAEASFCSGLGSPEKPTLAPIAAALALFNISRDSRFVAHCMKMMISSCV